MARTNSWMEDQKKQHVVDVYYTRTNVVAFCSCGQLRVVTDTREEAWSAARDHRDREWSDVWSPGPPKGGTKAKVGDACATPEVSAPIAPEPALYPTQLRLFEVSG